MTKEIAKVVSNGGYWMVVGGAKTDAKRIRSLETARKIAANRNAKAGQKANQK